MKWKPLRQYELTMVLKLPFHPVLAIVCALAGACLFALACWPEAALLALLLGAVRVLLVVLGVLALAAGLHGIWNYLQ